MPSASCDMSMTLILSVLSWPSLFTDCSIFPEFGQPQKRPQNHAPMTLLCEPHPPASFEWCTEQCIVQGYHMPARVNCSKTLCDCKERCMGTADVCTGSGASQNPTHRSLPQALNAHAGSAQLHLDRGGAALAAANRGVLCARVRARTIINPCITIIVEPPLCVSAAGGHTHTARCISSCIAAHIQIVRSDVDTGLGPEG